MIFNLNLSVISYENNTQLLQLHLKPVWEKFTYQFPYMDNLLYANETVVIWHVCNFTLLHFQS
jgi:hypothetical protein